jgi:hypothetical protein
LRLLQRTTAIRFETRLAAIRFRSRRDIIYTSEAPYVKVSMSDLRMAS